MLYVYLTLLVIGIGLVSSSFLPASGGPPSFLPGLYGWGLIIFSLLGLFFVYFFSDFAKYTIVAPILFVGITSGWVWYQSKLYVDDAKGDTDRWKEVTTILHHESTKFGISFSYADHSTVERVNGIPSAIHLTEYENEIILLSGSDTNPSVVGRVMILENPQNLPVSDLIKDSLTEIDSVCMIQKVPKEESPFQNLVANEEIHALSSSAQDDRFACLSNYIQNNSLLHETNHFEQLNQIFFIKDHNRVLGVTADFSGAPYATKGVGFPGDNKYINPHENLWYTTLSIKK